MAFVNSSSCNVLYWVHHYMGTSETQPIYDYKSGGHELCIYTQDGLIAHRLRRRLLRRPVQFRGHTKRVLYLLLHIDVRAEGMTC